MNDSTHPRSAVDQMFDPNRPGLHYKPIRYEALLKPVFVLRDHEKENWIDLRSVCESIGVAWKRFDLAIKSRRDYFKSEQCLDRKGRETELIQPERLLRWIDLHRPLIEQHSPAAVQRLLALRKAWRAKLGEINASAPSSTATEQRGAAEIEKQLRARKVSAVVVESLYRLRCQKIPFTKAATRLGIALSTAKKVASDTYPDLPPDAREAWDRTFGRISPSRAANTPAK